jgi:hypothetical protein
MFRSFKIFIVKNQNTIKHTSVGGSMLIGSGIGGYYSYTESRKYLYSECIFNTTLGTLVGAYFGLITMVTLPITLPVVTSVTILRYFDKDSGIGDSVIGDSGIKEYGFDHIRCPREDS